MIIRYRNVNVSSIHTRLATYQEHGLQISENRIFVLSSESGVHVIIPRITSPLVGVSSTKGSGSLTWVEWTYMIPAGPPY